MRILLFDIDSVLVEPHGYHRALADTTAVLGDLLGVEGARLSQSQIEAFEAAGVSSEWDSSAMCLVHLLQQIWRAGGTADLPDRLAPPAPPRTGIRADYDPLIARMATSALTGRPVVERSIDVLRSEPGLTSDQREESARLMSISRSDQSLPFVIFQELMVGSAAFTDIYRLPPRLATESYLKLYDLPLLDADASTRLIAWAGADDQRMAMLTARPGLPRLTPEAEMGAELVGLQSLPIASVGSLAWLGEVLGLSEQAMIKPNPIHALLGLLLAVHTPEDKILTAMRAFQAGQSHPALRQFDGAEVTVFEDALGGILSLRNLRDRLADLGIDLRANYIGVSDLPVKMDALRSAGARVVPNINIILNELL